MNIDKPVVGQVLSEGNKNFLNKKMDVSSGELPLKGVPEGVLCLIPEATARHYNVMPIIIADNILKVAMTDPVDHNLIKELRFITSMDIEPAAFSKVDILRAIEQVYRFKSTRNTEVENIRRHSGDSVRVSASTGRSPIVKLVNDTVVTAIRRNASDIHFEPTETELRIRYRIDGILQEANVVPNSRKAEVLSRIKIMASLDIAEKRRPQDGKIRIEHDGRNIDIRVSTLPTGFGEKIVLRILDRSSNVIDLPSLGLDHNKIDSFESAIIKPYGMILVTGPTGSGKTSTLYAALNRLKSSSVNISTVEDPIEYHVDGINQTQVKPEIGLTFATALRTLLRQDPNIIMVGEIRDRDTADIAVRAALTGHLVLSTLHTNDAPSAVVRLQDMGVEPFLITSSVLEVVGQRLVRRICEHCKE